MVGDALFALYKSLHPQERAAFMQRLERRAAQQPAVQDTAAPRTLAQIMDAHPEALITCLSMGSSIQHLPNLIHD
jgi:hypothetical protein